MHTESYSLTVLVIVLIHGYAIHLLRKGSRIDSSASTCTGFFLPGLFKSRQSTTFHDLNPFSRIAGENFSVLNKHVEPIKWQTWVIHTGSRTAANLWLLLLPQGPRGNSWCCCRSTTSRFPCSPMWRLLLTITQSEPNKSRSLLSRELGEWRARIPAS